jgi:hypothetical protein
MNPLKSAAQAKSKLNRPSKQGCKTGEDSGAIAGMTNQKFKDKSLTSAHVPGSKLKAFGPGATVLRNTNQQ